MDLRQIRYFAAVQETKSALAASRRLNISQPALSKGLRELEASLGRRLFTRHARGMTLTAAGEQFAVHAAAILAAVDRASSAFGSKAASARNISIGASPTPGRTLLPDVLRYAGRRDPKLRLLVQQGSNQELFDLLSRGALDAILCYATPSFKGIAVRPLFHEDLYLIGVPGAAAVSRGDVDFDRAAGLPLVLDPRSHIGRCQIDRVARRRKVPLNLVAEIEPLEAKRSMMVERGCYTILPYGSIVDEAAAGMLAAARIVNPGLMLTLSLIVPRWVPADVERVLLKVIRPVVRDKIAARTLRWQPAGATIRAAR